MKFSEFVFHGVPQGFDVWGTSGDKYYESFYNILDAFKEAKPVFVAEIRKDSNRWCTYYSYIRSQNILAEGGRTGSYFGMSLKMDGEYCTDVYSLFQLMDTIYEQKVVGKIVAQNGSSEKFIVPTFAAASTDLKEISSLFISQIKSNFESDFDDIEPSLSKKNPSTSVYYNVNDVNSESFFNATKEYGKIFISNVYPSKDAIIANFTSSDKRYQAIKTEYEGQIDSLKTDNRQIPGLKSSIESLSQELEKAKADAKSLSTDKSSLQNKVNSLQQELNAAIQEKDKLKKLSNVGAVAEKLEPSLSEILSLLKAAKPSTKQYEYTSHQDYPYGHHRNDSGHHHNHDGGEYGDGGVKKYLPYILAIIAVGIAIFFLLKGIKSGPIISELRETNHNLTEQMNSVQEKCIRLENENNNLKSELEEARNYSQNNNSVKIRFFTAIDNQEVRDPSSLIKGCSYIVKVSGVKKGYWKADGFTFSGPKDGLDAMVQVSRNGTVILSYYTEDGIRVIKNTYKVKQQ